MKIETGGYTDRIMAQIAGIDSILKSIRQNIKMHRVEKVLLLEQPVFAVHDSYRSIYLEAVHIL